jgi:hypothetical protein
VTEVFEEFARRGLLFTWEENGKRYGHWTGSDVPGRLPAPSWRARLERLAPAVPRDALRAYMARFGGAPLAAGRRSGDAVEAGGDGHCDSEKKQRRVNAKVGWALVNWNSSLSLRALKHRIWIRV